MLAVVVGAECYVRMLTNWQCLAGLMFIAFTITIRLAC